MPIVLKKPNLSFWERLYLPEIFKGMLITARHLFKNLFNPKSRITYSWPDEAKPILDTHRSEHRLMLREDGSIRCTACMLCATACPAHCIHIVAAEGPHPKMEKYAREYTIDHLRCVYCGLCVEACPCDAIRMDTQKLVSSGQTRESFIRDIHFLKNNHQDKTPYSVANYP